MKAVFQGARAPLSLLFVAALSSACNSGGSSSSGSPGVAPLTTVTPTLTKDYFPALLQSSSLADLQTSNQSGLSSRAFALEDRAFVHVIDLSGATPVSVLQLGDRVDAMLLAASAGPDGQPDGQAAGKGQPG